MSYNSFTRSFKTLPYGGNCNQTAEVKLATNNTDSHMNLIVDNRSITMLPGDAARLRDLLLEAYPLATKPAPAAPQSKFKVGDKVTYKAIVGYGGRGLDGRKGEIRTVQAGEWYEVKFLGGPFDHVVKVHSDYLVATEVPRKIRVGDTVRRLAGGSHVLPTGTICTVTWMSESGHTLRVSGRSSTFDTEYFELAHANPVDAVKAAVPVLTIEDGRYIVAALEGANYAPNSKPYVHLTDKAAEAEAERLAKEIGGTFHVFKATFEASREKPVIPPVKTAKL